MTRIIAIFAIAAVLAACSTTRQTQVVESFEYIPIPQQYLDCDRKQVRFPDPATLTDEQIVAYIEQIDLLYKECRTDIASIRQWQAELINTLMRVNAKG